MNIFIGCTETANLMCQYTQGFEALGHKVRAMAFFKNKYYLENNYYDRILENDRWYYKKETSNFFIKVIQNIYLQLAAWIYMKSIVDDTDVFIFVAGSFNRRQWDLPYLKRKGKKIIFINCGSEVRYTEAFCSEFGVDRNAWSGHFSKDSFNKKLAYLRKIEKYSDVIYSIPDQSGLALKPYFHLKLPFNVDTVVEKIPARVIPHIVHCPTRRIVKGSDTIENALDSLKRDGYSFEYQSLTNRSNSEILTALTEADIVIDELYFPGPGVLGMEAMCAGAVECTRHIPNKRADWLPPVWAIDESDIYSRLKELLDDSNLRNSLAMQGREYVKKHHSPQAIAKALISHLEDSASKPHYWPSFFLEKFKQSNEKISKSNLKDNKLLLLRFGCRPETNLANAVERGLLPKLSIDELNSIKRWSHESAD